MHILAHVRHLRARLHGGVLWPRGAANIVDAVLQAVQRRRFAQGGCSSGSAAQKVRTGRLQRRQCKVQPHVTAGRVIRQDPCMAVARRSCGGGTACTHGVDCGRGVWVCGGDGVGGDL
eukprot:364079-Chlamydomonas_euryale.AAC.6